MFWVTLPFTLPFLARILQRTYQRKLSDCNICTLQYEGQLTIEGPGRLSTEPGLSDVQATLGKGKLPVTTERRRLVCKAWLKPGQYRVKIPLELGVIWYEHPRGRVSARRNYTVQEKLRLTLGQHIRTDSLTAILATITNCKHNAS